MSRSTPTPERRLAAPLGAGGAAFDAAPPASIVRSTLSSRSAWRGAPHREGCFAAAVLSAARSARRPTSDTPCPRPGRAETGKSRLRRASVKQHDVFDSRCLPSTGVPRARLRETGNPPPLPGSWDRGIGFQRHALLACAEKAGQGTIPGLITPRPARPAPPVNFCNHCGSPAQLRWDRPPRGPHREFPPCAVVWAALHLAAQRRPSGLRSGAAEGSWPSPAPPRAMTRRGASPRADWLGHLLSRSRACARRRIRAQEEGTGSRESVSGRRAGRRPHEGRRFRPSAKRGRGQHARGAFHRQAAPRGRHNNPQVVSSLWITSCGAFGIGG
jgi:hypothetical protein